MTLAGLVSYHYSFCTLIITFYLRTDQLKLNAPDIPIIPWFSHTALGAGERGNQAVCS